MDGAEVRGVAVASAAAVEGSADLAAAAGSPVVEEDHHGDS